jgi:hypothetical protein
MALILPRKRYTRRRQLKKIRTRNSGVQVK